MEFLSRLPAANAMVTFCHASGGVLLGGKTPRFDGLFQRIAQCSSASHQNDPI